MSRPARPGLQEVAARLDRDLPEVVVATGRLEGCTFLDDSVVDAVAVGVVPAVEGDDEPQPRDGTVDASTRYGVDLAELASRSTFRGGAGTTRTIDLPRPHRGSAAALPWSGLPPRIVLVGLGDESPRDLRRAGAALARATRGLERVVTTVAGTATQESARAFVEGYLLGAYRAPSFATGTAGPPPAEQLVLLGAVREGTVDAAARSARATWLARDLTAVPSNIKTPAWFAQRATELADGEGLDVRVLRPDELAAAGLGGILAVGRASAHPPRLVTVAYEPFDPEQARSGQHVVLVGKGITYDTGGLSIKPREAMVPMKTDMAGAAVALAAVLGAAQARLPHRVTAVLPLAENQVGSAAYRPGDVLVLGGGRTVEIANTDAEGRLVLADALAYADAELAPDILIDVATLTGASAVGLGRGHAALYSADPDLVDGIMDAAARTGEQVWPMPLEADYLPALESSVADLRHVPEVSHGGGSITAALFLRAFVGSRRWAHLDIAGPARSGAAAHEVPKGATGYGARLLLRYLESLG